MRLTRVGPVGPLDLSRPASQPPLPGMMAVAGPSISSHNFGAAATNPSYMGHQRQQRQQHYGDAYLGDTTGFSSEVSGGCSSLLSRPLCITAPAAEPRGGASPPLCQVSVCRPRSFKSSTAVPLKSMSSFRFADDFLVIRANLHHINVDSKIALFNGLPFLSFRPPVLGQLVTQPVVIVGFSTLPLRMALTGIGATQTATETRILRYG